MAGRPSDYSDELALKICVRLSEGESLVSVCRDEDMPCRSSVFNWLQQSQSFLDRYNRARELQADSMLDWMSEIAHDGAEDWVMTKRGPVVDSECVGRSRLRVDTMKWQMAKLAPKKYGDFQRVENTNKTDLEGMSLDDLKKKAAELAKQLGI